MDRQWAKRAASTRLAQTGDALVDESPLFVWLPCATSLKRFGYDLDGVFSPDGDDWNWLQNLFWAI